MPSVIRGDDNFDSSVEATDEKADVYVYAAYRSGTTTLYPGFNVGSYHSHVGGQSNGNRTGTFTNGSYSSEPNYGSYQHYISLAIRTG